MGQVRLILGVSSSLTVTHHSQKAFSEREIGQSQRPPIEKTQELQETDIHAPGGIRTRNHSMIAVAGPRIRRLRQWNRRLSVSSSLIFLT